jgi:hypothetical protein
MNTKVYAMMEEARKRFPSSESDAANSERKLDSVLSNTSWLLHAFLFDGTRFVLRTQPTQTVDEQVREDREYLADYYPQWLASNEGKVLVNAIDKKPNRILFHLHKRDRLDNPAILLIALFVIPQATSNRVVIGGASFDPLYLKNAFFPEILEESISRWRGEGETNSMAIMVYSFDSSAGSEIKPLAFSGDWRVGQPEVIREFHDVFRGLALGMKCSGMGDPAG